MQTEQLIELLARDQTKTLVPGKAIQKAMLVGAAAALLFWALIIGPRADLTQVLTSWRFAFKVILWASVLGFALRSLWQSAHPLASERFEFWRSLALPGALLLLAVVLELLQLPSAQWGTAALGKNRYFCLLVIPMLGLAPLTALIWRLREAAPARPMIAGFWSGISAGALAAVLYAFHCMDDSPLFVGLWYSIAIAGLAGLGALAGRKLLRW